MATPGYNSISQTAFYWDTPWATVKKWCVAGRIPGAIVDNGRYLIPADAARADVLPLTAEQLAEHKRRQMAGRSVSSNSGYRGVYRRRSRWAAIISVDGKGVHLGTFDSPVQAARAWDKRARELRGPDAQLNFPER